MANVSSLDDMHTETSVPYELSEQEALEFATMVQFMRGDSDRVMFRRFQKLNLYNLLFLHHQILSLDEQVSRFDFDGDWLGADLAMVLPRVRPLLKEYNELLLTQVQLNNLPTPSPGALSSIKTHATECLKPLLRELGARDGWSDLTILTPGKRGWLHKLADKHHPVSKLFKEQDSQNTKSGLYRYSERWVEMAEEFIVNAVFSVLILAPIWILSYVQGKVAKLSIILLCVLITNIAASLLAGSAQKASLAVVLSYAAILVVFMSTQGSS